jgi:hypothetical protein
VGLSITGCTTAPEIPSDDEVSMIDVVDRVRCELKHATTFFRHDPKRADKIAAAGVTIANEILDKNNKDYPNTRFSIDDLLTTEQVPTTLNSGSGTSSIRWPRSSSSHSR